MLTAVRLESIEDLATDAALETIVGPLANVERQVFDSGGFSSSTFVKIKATQQSGGTTKFVLKRTRLSDDWLSQRTSDSTGREAAMVTDAALSAVWDFFACPYRACASSNGEIGLLMDDLSNYLLPDEREPISVLHEDLVIAALAEMHARFWESDELTMDWLLAPADYLRVMGPGDHPSDEQAPPPESLRDMMRDGWETALNELPSSISHQLVRPASELAEPWDRLPVTLLHGDTKIANLAVFPDRRVAALDWGFAGRAPCTFELGWYLAVNATRLARGKDHLVSWYRHRLEIALGGRLYDHLWNDMILAGVVCGAMMLLWTKGYALRVDRPGAREEFAWWARHLEYWAADFV